MGWSRLKGRRPHYAWVIMLAGFLVMMSLSGVVLAATSSFLKPVSEALHISRTRFSSYNLVSGLVGILAGVNAGAILKRLGLRRSVILGACMIGGAFWGYSVSDRMWHFWIFGGISGFGTGFSATVVCSVLINNWFQEKKGFATSVAFMGTSVGNLIFSRLAKNIWIDRFGWRMTYRLFGLSILAIAVLTALFLIVDRPEDEGLLPYGGREADSPLVSAAASGVTRAAFLRSPAFLLLAAVALLSGIVTLGVQNHMFAFLSDIGYVTAAAANIYTAQLIAQMIGKLALGAMLDRAGVRAGMVYICAVHMMGMTGFLRAEQAAFAYLGAVGLGLSVSVCTIVPPYLTAQLVGDREYADIMGVINIFLNIGVTASTMCTSAIYDKMGYRAAWLIYAVGMAVVTCFVFLALKIGTRSYWREEITEE